jgi:hypothetical protein
MPQQGLLTMMHGQADSGATRPVTLWRIGPAEVRSEHRSVVAKIGAT